MDNQFYQRLSYERLEKSKTEATQKEAFDYTGMASSGMDMFANVIAGLHEYNMLSFNKKQAELEGRQAIIIGEQKSNAIRDQLNEATGTASAVYGARGVSRSSGTPMSMFELSTKRAGEDIQQVRETAEKQKRAKDYEARQAGIAKKGALWKLGYQTSAKGGEMFAKAYSGGLV